MRLPSRPRQARSLSAENQYFLLAYAFLAFLSVFELYQTALADDLPYPAASQARRGAIRRAGRLSLDATAPPDEPQGGKTERGTPVNLRGEASFPAETRNVFNWMDAVPDAARKPQPFDYLEAGYVSLAARDADSWPQHLGALG